MHSYFRERRREKERDDLWRRLEQLNLSGSGDDNVSSVGGAPFSGPTDGIGGSSSSGGGEDGIEHVEAAKSAAGDLPSNNSSSILSSAATAPPTKV